MDAARLRVAVIGLGLWGARAHLPALVACPDVELVALADPDVVARGAVAAAHGIRDVFDDGARLLESVEHLDAVVVATPTDTHHDLVLAACRRGLHLLCEKPLALDLPQARRMVESLEASGRIGKIGFLFRFSPAMSRLRQLVAEGAIGEVQLVEVRAVNAQFADPARPLHWKMRRARANGGAFVEYGAHSLDLAQWLAGPITRVVAHGLTLVPERPDRRGGTAAVDVDDAATVIAVHAGGAESVVRVGWASYPVGGDGLRVYGSRGSLAWELDPSTHRAERLLRSTPGSAEPEVLTELTVSWDPDAADGALGLSARYNAGLVRSFVDDVRSGIQTSPSFRDGLRAQAALAAVRRSLDAGAWVEIDPIP
ncbi:MAG TPA: Gfo/Idh/MocA family oxidoreductase [Thermomicrobiaceae bacterium]|nr:Gfo/Idh/MocA family oxidoreductase [Thermomicrobiaceae bacterium]